MSSYQHIKDAIKIIKDLDFPRAQQNERSALCLLSLLNLTPDKNWEDAENPLVGITPMMDFSRDFYAKQYKPNTRETFRRQTIHQFVAAGLALYNPDDPDRPVNSPKAVYQIEPTALALIRTYGLAGWKERVADYLIEVPSLATHYAKERKIKKIPIKIAPGKTIKISPGDHSQLIKKIIESFASMFVSGGQLIYVGDTGDKWAYFDKELLGRLGVSVGAHGKMPDVVIYDHTRNWLLLIEAVTSHGPVDGKRHDELSALFSESKVGLVFVTAFPTRMVMSRYLGEIAWETEVWVAEAPTHLIHFNGVRFLGPYPK